MFGPPKESFPCGTYASRPIRVKGATGETLFRLLPAYSGKVAAGGLSFGCFRLIPAKLPQGDSHSVASCFILVNSAT